MQSQQDLVKTVSKNLKYYFDVKRREDGFDLSGPYVPRPDHPPLKSRPTLMYDGLHDKAVKHYFTKHEARQRITHMKPPDPFTMDKARNIKRQIRRYMNKYTFTMPWISTTSNDPKGITNSSKYVTDPFQMLRETPHETPKFTKPFRGGRPLLRAAPPHTISRGEAVRLVNAASRSLFALINGYSKDDRDDSAPRLPWGEDDAISGYNFPPMSTPHRHRPATAGPFGSQDGDGGRTSRWLGDSGQDSHQAKNDRARAAPAKYSEFAPERPKSAHAVLRRNRESDSEDDERGLTDGRLDSEDDERGQTDGRRVARPPSWERPSSRGDYDDEPLLTPVPPAVPRSASSSATTRSGHGSKKTVAKSSSSSTSSDSSSSSSRDDDAEVPVACASAPVPAMVEAVRAQLGAGGRQRQLRPKSAKRVDRTEPDRQSEERSHSRVTLSEDGSYEEVPLDETDPEDEAPPAAVPKKVSEEKCVQTGWELFTAFDPSHAVVLEGPKAQYTIRVRTGKVIGASGNVPIHVVLFGSRGCSHDIPLESSTTYKIPFQKGQEDIFNVETMYVGELKQIRIGHNRVDTGQWYLDSVAVDDLTKGWVYEFPCNNWLSSKSSDKMTRRDLVYSSTRLIVSPDEHMRLHVDENVAQISAIAPASPNSKAAQPDAEQTAAEAHLRDRQSPSVSMGYSRQSTDGSHDSASNHAASSPITADASQNESDGRLLASTLAMHHKNPHADDAPPAKSSIPGKKKDKRRAENSFFDILLKGSGSNSPGPADDEDSESAGSGYYDFFDLNPRVPLTSAAEARDRNENGNEDAASETDSQERSTVVFEDASLTSRELRDDDGYILGSKVHASPRAAEASATAKSAVQPNNANADGGSTLLTTGPSIHGASRVGNLLRIKELVRYYQDLKNTPDDFGDTPLHIACQYGHADTVQWLLESAKVDDRIRNRAGYEAAHVAALHGHIGCLRSIISSGTTKDVNVRSDDDKTLLHLAASAGHLQTCRFLVANGASLSARDSFGRTSADIASEYNHSEVHDYLAACQHDLDLTGIGTAISTDDPKATKGLVHVGDVGLHRNGSSAPLLDDVKESFPNGDDETSIGSSAVDLRHKIEHQQELEDKKRLYEEMQEKKRSGMTFLDMVRQEAGGGSDASDTN